MSEGKEGGLLALCAFLPRVKGRGGGGGKGNIFSFTNGEGGGKWINDQKTGFELDSCSPTLGVCFFVFWGKGGEG